VNMGVKESAWLLGIPMATSSTARIVHKGLRILITPLK
jgi:hypothetical protein